MVFCLQGVSVFAEGDPNIDNGGGNLQDGSKDNFWNPGNDGVRVTIVDSQTGLAKSSSIDYTNTDLGVGIVSFMEKVPDTEIAAGDYDYRVDTDVYTSVTVSGGEHTPDNPVIVKFYIKNRVYTVRNVVFPEGGSQLVWCKWHTPTTEQTGLTVENGLTRASGNSAASPIARQ